MNSGATFGGVLGNPPVGHHATSTAHFTCVTPQEYEVPKNMMRGNCIFGFQLLYLL